MNDFKIIRAMLLGVAFTNLLSAATCCEDIDSNNNPTNQNHSDSISYLAHMDKILSVYDEDNKTMPIYQQDILGQPNYLLNLHATKKDILKRAILSEDIILKQKLDIEEIFNKQNALDTITVIGENLKRDESYIQSAIYALNVLGIKSNEISKLTKLPLKSSNYNEVLKLYDSVQKTKSDLIGIRDKKLTPSNISDGNIQGANVNQEELIKAIDNIKHNIPRLSITSSLESIDNYINMLNKISKPNNDKTSINDFIADVRILKFFNVNIDSAENFDPDPMYDYTYDYDEFNKIYKEAYGIANNQVQAHIDNLLNILKNQMDKALKLKYIKEEIEYFKNNNKQDELKKAMDEYKFHSI
ncbi:hypothetical protein [Campylobacter mucosalis]|uniref:hypothetical protein n=1 Tax=Campylobacter mucosalis TaxID=202 RepID=UPI0014705910|nr:hypothetical protein [Campylobacter mucosalis]